MLKKIFLIILILTITTGFSSLSYANQAIILSDEELDNISAGGIDANILGLLIASTAAYRSAVDLATQGTAWVNPPEPTIAQGNTATVVAQDGSIDGATVTNTNSLEATNSSDISLLQDNIAVVAALSGSISGATIENSNSATLTNWEGSAAYQRNIAVAIANGGTIDNGTTINNTNFANIDIAANHFDSSDVLGGNINFDCFISQSASVLQINIAVIAALNNGTSNPSATNANIATTYHFPFP